MKGTKKMKNKKFYVITFEDGTTEWAEEATYSETLSFAEREAGKRGGEFTIEEYDSYNDYINNI